MALDIMSLAHPRMLLWGQLMRNRVCQMWCWRLRTFVKFGRGTIIGGLAMSAATSSYEMIVSILVIAHARGRSCLLFTKNC
jgi:hypothetical protein